jgi:GNAT superfamily N-acetyltransferase
LNSLPRLRGRVREGATASLRLPVSAGITSRFTCSRSPTADVQSNGYIDHFFVTASCARQGVGTLLMHHLHAVARARSIPVLTSDVSRTAQPFFARFGFAVIEQKEAVIRGVVVPNAHMRKELEVTQEATRGESPRLI